MLLELSGEELLCEALLWDDTLGMHGDLLGDVLSVLSVLVHGDLGAHVGVHGIEARGVLYYVGWLSG